ncbi:hypothetical protein M406DRAFT_348628 [Cryphonectria parasitica EP155]|uniref:Multicopper oxidase n=1 Tax=Cryphonectria parasitica (strain ATCC 38755 / EP155) TaxID=660469 RepID=A0A9P5CJ42_CRYP1|nr:uncharacterized protein M406DRAFT_348628 [Cryphonectria parasitica EP155]KAF3759902.1 hypothetical protein M406DRAFT_348628 [Cryphonectria parasitica EP155]
MVWNRALGIILKPEDHNRRNSAVRYLSWNISSEFRRPDGVRKEVILINGMFPGPTIEGRPGDTIEVEIYNSYREGISIHWHGLHMRGANHMDGPVGITQCEIQPGSLFRYRFDIAEDQTGTFWYHAHSQIHRGDGLYGGLVIHEPLGTKSSSSQDHDAEILLLAGDWYHHQSSRVLESFMSSTGDGNEPCPDSLLVNGMGHFDCSREVPAKPVDCTISLKPTITLNKRLRYRIRLINAGSLAGISMGIPDALLNITYVDGGQEVTSDVSNSVGILYPGERVDFTLEWPQSKPETRDFQSPNLALEPIQTFTILSPGSTQSAQNTEALQSSVSLQRVEGPILREPLPNPDVKFVIYSAMQILNRLGNVPTGFVNRTHWVAQDRPLLSMNRESWDEHQLVPWTGEKPAWVELVINNLDGTGHSFHLHGFDFYVISSYRGKGGWDYYNPFDPSREPRGGAFNLLNPVRKDTVYVPPFGYVVLRFLADNEGIWLLHCHVLWHQASGMTMAFQVLGDEVEAFRDTLLGQDAGKTCPA